jgi:hypothetical protein
LVTLAALLTLSMAHLSASARAQQPDDSAQVRELAERLIASPRLGPGAQRLTVELLPGRLPPELAADIVLPAAQHRLLGSAVRRSEGRPVGATVALDTAASAAELFGYYETELSARGWQTTPMFGPGGAPRGLQPTGVPIHREYCRGPNGPQLSLTLYPSASGPSDLRLNLDTLFTDSCRVLRGPPLAPGADQLPPLTAPANIELLPSNPQPLPGGGKPALATSDAIAVTTMDVAALAEHFARQLESAGWVRDAARLDGPLAWMLWRVPGQGDWQGVLYVVEGPGSGQRTIHVRVATASAPGR